MSLFSKTIFVVFGFLMISNGAKASFENSKNVLLVGSGGWKSCRNGVFNQFIALQFNNLLKNLKTTFPEKNFTYVLSCADGFASVYGGRPLKYYTSEMRAGTYNEVAQNRFYQIVAKKITAPDTAVYLIGHSHGGWYSMKVVESLTVPVAGLFTLEPISAVGCNTITYMHNRHKPVRPWAEQPMRACRQAPADTQNQLIAEKTELWMNYHLPSNQYRGDLFSGPLSVATNVEKRINSKEPHSLLGMDAFVWNSVCHEISEQLGAQAEAVKCPTPIVNKDGQFIRWAKDLY